MHVASNTRVGVDLPSIGLGPYQIGGIVIDNPSGSWLSLPEISDHVPPYTKGWAVTVYPTVARVSVLFRDGPAGQVSTLAGDPIHVELYDGPPPGGDSAGTTAGAGFVTQFTPLLVASQQGLLLRTSNPLTNYPVLLFSIPGIRVRIKSTAVSISNNGVGSFDSNVFWGLFPDNLNDTFLSGRLTRDNPATVIVADIDWPVGVGVNCGGLPEWADTIIDVFVRYVVI